MSDPLLDFDADIQRHIALDRLDDPTKEAQSAVRRNLAAMIPGFAVAGGAIHALAAVPTPSIVPPPCLPPPPSVVVAGAPGASVASTAGASASLAAKAAVAGSLFSSAAIVKAGLAVALALAAGATGVVLRHAGNPSAAEHRITLVPPASPALSARLPSAPTAPLAVASPSPVPAASAAEMPFAPFASAPEPGPRNTRAANVAVGEMRNLAVERPLLDRAQDALRKDDAEGALRPLYEHASRFPRGDLQEEREAMVVKALARAGREREAHAAADQFRRHFPDSMLISKTDLMPNP